jgi:hypothetical protein
MSRIDIRELVSSVTPEKEARMAKIEGLIKLRQALQEDLESIKEIADEILEQRRENLESFGLSTAAIDTSITGLLDAYKSTQNAAYELQIETMESA